MAKYFEEKAAIPIDAVKVFGSKEKKKKLSDLELEYDKKFNGFCLTAASMSAEKLNNTLATKENQLKAAKDELKSADKESKLELRLKISYLEDCIKKCKALAKKKSVNESTTVCQENALLAILGISAVAAAAAGIKALASKLAKSKKDHKEEHKKETEKIKEDLIKEEKKDIEDFREKLIDKCASEVKKYSKSSSFKEKYKDSLYMVNVKPDYEYGVEITEYSCGIDWDAVEKWEKKHPDEDWQKQPQFSGAWYFDLLREGEKISKETAKSMNTDERYIIKIDTGDGDECLIYIDVYLKEK